MTESHRATAPIRDDARPAQHLPLPRIHAPTRPQRDRRPVRRPAELYEATRDEMVEAIPSLVEFLKTQVET